MTTQEQANLVEAMVSGVPRCEYYNAPPRHRTAPFDGCQTVSEWATAATLSQRSYLCTKHAVELCLWVIVEFVHLRTGNLFVPEIEDTRSLQARLTKAGNEW